MLPAAAGLLLAAALSPGCAAPPAPPRVFIEPTHSLARDGLSAADAARLVGPPALAWSSPTPPTLFASLERR